MGKLHVLLYIGKNQLPEIPGHDKLFDIKYINIEDAKRIVSDPNIKIPDVIIVDYFRRTSSGKNYCFRDDTRYFIT